MGRASPEYRVHYEYEYMYLYSPYLDVIMNVDIEHTIYELNLVYQKEIAHHVQTARAADALARASRVFACSGPCARVYTRAAAS